jgi:hypothetical protein
MPSGEFSSRFNEIKFGTADVPDSPQKTFLLEKIKEEMKAMYVFVWSCAHFVSYRALKEYNKMISQSKQQEMPIARKKFQYKSDKRLKEDQYCRNFIEDRLFQDEEFIKRVRKIWGKEACINKIKTDDVLRWIKLLTTINNIRYVENESNDQNKHEKQFSKIMGKTKNKWVVTLEQELNTLKEIVEHVKRDIPLSWINVQLSDKDISEEAEK